MRALLRAPAVRVAFLTRLVAHSSSILINSKTFFALFQRKKIRKASGRATFFGIGGRPGNLRNLDPSSSQRKKAHGAEASTPRSAARPSGVRSSPHVASRSAAVNGGKVRTQRSRNLRRDHSCVYSSKGITFPTAPLTTPFNSESHLNSSGFD